MRILILGHGEHGKDAAAEILTKLTGLPAIASSRFACQHFLRKKLETYGLHYPSLEACYEDRRNHRELWKALICSYVREDKTRLAVELTAEYPIYVGMRDIEEFDATEDLFDHILYVVAPQRVPRVDPTMEIPVERASIIIDNNGTLADLEELLGRFVRDFDLAK